jgi:hypothetical protein
MSELSDSERDLLFHIETYGLSPARAAKLTGVADPYSVLKRPEVVAARNAMRRSAQASLRVTREDVINGLMEAIYDAKLLADPMSQIRGWAEVRKTAGLDEPLKVNLNITDDSKRVRKELAALSDDDLYAMVDDAGIIDADFRVISNA